MCKLCSDVFRFYHALQGDFDCESCVCFAAMRFIYRVNTMHRMLVWSHIIYFFRVLLVNGLGGWDCDENSLVGAGCLTRSLDCVIGDPDNCDL